MLLEPANMPRLEIPQGVEVGGPPLSLQLAKGVGNNSLTNALTRFEKFGMNGPKATEALLKTVAPLKLNQENAMQLNAGVNPPKEAQNLWDQVSGAFIEGRNPTQQQRDSLAVLSYFALESFASANPPDHDIKGQPHPMSEENHQLAQQTFDKYGELLQQKMDPDNPTSKMLLNVGSAVGKAAFIAGTAIELVSCAPSVIAKAMNVEVTASAPTINTQQTLLSSTVLKTKISLTQSPLNIPKGTEAPHSNQGYTFHELWSKYLNVQMLPGTPIGKVVDFAEYCTPFKNGCGFNTNDPNFDSEFHGHVAGYSVVFEKGKWIYYALPTVTPTPTSISNSSGLHK